MSTTPSDDDSWGADAELMHELVLHGARIAATVRDYGPDAFAELLARTPAGRTDLLVLALAAMVDPDRTPLELVGWSVPAGTFPTTRPTTRPTTSPTTTPAKVTQKGIVRRGRAPRPREHGTERGYFQHRNRDDMPPCPACLDAHAAESRANRAGAARLRSAS